MKRIFSYCLLFLILFYTSVYFHHTIVNAADAYTVLSRRKAPEYEGTATYYEHNATGATAVYIENDDTEKAFTIGFSTPTFDDTGVNHILEHCLLNGSVNAPSKPFTWLINHTAATYLNAMTFHDFTAYVLASRDESEYRRLMATYLDRVFYPTAMADESIFRQEGWRENAGVYNGTVYNEMKGVYSTDDAYLQRAAYASLFPEGTYRYESGGMPEAIPTLTFERFKKVYEDNYIPGGALAVFYGRQDINASLALLDEGYLSKCNAGKSEGHTRKHYCGQPPAGPVFVRASYPAGQGMSSMAVSYAVCDRCDTLLTAKMELLAAWLNDRNAAVFDPMIKQGAASQVSVDYNNMMSECVLSINIKGINPARCKEIKAMADDCVKLAAGRGYSDQRTQSVRYKYLYNLADAKNTPHRGIDAGVEEMSAFVYGQAVGEAAYREAVDTFDKRFIKDAVNKYLLNNPHMSVVVLSPDKSNPEWPVKEFIHAGADINTRYPAAVVKLEPSPTEPTMINRVENTGAGKMPVYKTETLGGIRLIHTCLDTHGIASIHLFIDATSLPQPLIGYAQILAHTLPDVQSLPSGFSSGDIYGYMSADKTMGSDDFVPRLHLSLRGLNSDVALMAKTGAMLLKPGVLLEKQTVYGYLVRAKLVMDNNFENQMPAAGCLARLSKAGLYDYEINGLTYYQFVSGLLSDFDNLWPDISVNLAGVKKYLLNDSAAVISFTGSDEAYKRFRKQTGVFEKLFVCGLNKEYCPAGAPVAYHIPEPIVSVFPAPLSQTHAVVQAGSLKKAGGSYNGAFLVSASLLNYDYLWPLIRDTGGAYGINASVSPDGSVLLRSFRDPNLETTLGAYKSIPDFLRRPVSEDDFAGVRSHVLAEWDEQFQPYRLWDYGAKVELGMIDPERIDRTRYEIMYAMPGDLKYDADIWDRILKQDITSVGGNSK